MSKHDLIVRAMLRRCVSDYQFDEHVSAYADTAGYAAVDDVLRIIDLVPAVDAEPVRHGHWRYVPRSESGLAYPYWICSACEEICFTDVPRAVYCPRCGARMDAEAEGGAEK